MWLVKKEIKMREYSRRIPKEGIEKVYQPGEIVKGVGVVETNHFGLPWPTFMNPNTNIGGELCGVITVRVHSTGKLISLDAVTLKILTPEQLEERKNNRDFNYFKSGICDHTESLPTEYFDF